MFTDTTHHNKKRLQRLVVGNEKGVGRTLIPDSDIETSMSTTRTITLIEEDDGGWSAIDEETGVASCGDTRSEALDMLDEAVELHESDEDSIETAAEEREVLRDLGIDPDEVADARAETDELPEFMQ